MAATSKGVNFRIAASVVGQAAVSSFTKAVKGIGEAGQVAKNTMLGYSKELNAQTRLYSPLTALMAAYDVQINAINRAHGLGSISADKYAAAVDNLESAYSGAKKVFADSPADGVAFLEQFGSELNRLTGLYNPAAAAAAAYDTKVVELNTALDLGIINVNQYANAVQRIPGSLSGAIDSSRMMAFANKSAAESADIYTSQFKALTDEFNPHKAKVDQLTAATQRLRQAHMLEIVTDEEYAAALFKIDTQMKKLHDSTGNVMAVGRKWNKGLSDNHRAVQNLGFQVSDFFVQVAGGQNIMLAFMQQSGQVVQFFGMWGSIAAAAITVGGLLFMSFAEGKDTVGALTKNLEAMDTSIGNLNAASKALSSDGLTDLEAMYGRVDASLIGLLVRQKELAGIAVQGDAESALRTLADEYLSALKTTLDPASAGAGMMPGGAGIMLLINDVKKVREEMGLTDAQADQLKVAIESALTPGASLQEMARQVEVIEGVIRQSSVSTDELGKKISELALKMRAAVQAAKGFEANMVRPVGVPDAIGIRDARQAIVEYNLELMRGVNMVRPDQWVNNESAIMKAKAAIIAYKLELQAGTDAVRPEFGALEAAKARTAIDEAKAAILAYRLELMATTSMIRPEFNQGWVGNRTAIDAATAAIAAHKAEYQGLLDQLNREIALNAVISQYGADSWNAKAQQLSVDRQITEESLKTAGYTGDQVRNLMSAWDAAKGIKSVNLAAGVEAASAAAMRLYDNLMAGWRTMLRMGGMGPPAAVQGVRPEGIAAGLGTTASRQAVVEGQIAIMRASEAAAEKAAKDTAKGGSGGGESEIDKIRKAFDQLAGSIDPTTAANNRFAEAQKTVNEAVKAGVVGGEAGAQVLAKLKSQLAETTEQAKEMKSVADSLASSFMSEFDKIRKGSESLGDGIMNMIDKVLDKSVEMLMSPVFSGLASMITGGLFGITGAMPPMPSFAGGGSTGNAPRRGGVDGKGGFFAIMHPQERVTDNAMGGGSGDGGSAAPVVIHVHVNGATGNQEVRQMVDQGVSSGLRYYDSRVLPSSLRRISNDPRRNT